MNSILAAPDIGLGIASLLLRRSRTPPAHHGIVVVCAGVDDFVFGAMRQIHVRAFIPETELQNRHPRNFQPLPQCVHFRSDVPQILRKKWQSPQRLAEFQEQVISWSIHPATIHCRIFARGNFPELVESPEVVQSDVVAVFCRPAQALDPPLVAAFLHYIPTV